MKVLSNLTNHEEPSAESLERNNAIEENEEDNDDEECWDEPDNPEAEP